MTELYSVERPLCDPNENNKPLALRESKTRGRILTGIGSLELQGTTGAAWRRAIHPLFAIERFLQTSTSERLSLSTLATVTINLHGSPPF